MLKLTINWLVGHLAAETNSEHNIDFIDLSSFKLIWLTYLHVQQVQSDVSIHVESKSYSAFSSFLVSTNS